MAKLGCTCGHVIVDQAGGLPYRAALFSDQGVERLWSSVAADVARGLSPDRSEARREWIAGYFGTGYPSDASDEEIIFDVLTAAEARLRRTVYECGSCGRLWVQAGPDTQRFVAYSPDEPGEGGVLRPAAGPDAPPGMLRG